MDNWTCSSCLCTSQHAVEPMWSDPKVRPTREMKVYSKSVQPREGQPQCSIRTGAVLPALLVSGPGSGGNQETWKGSSNGEDGYRQRTHIKWSQRTQETDLCWQSSGQDRHFSTQDCPLDCDQLQRYCLQWLMHCSGVQEAKGDLGEPLTG